MPAELSARWPIPHRSFGRFWEAERPTTHPRLAPIAGARSCYRPIYWTVDSGDWTRDATAAALPRLIDDLRAAGFNLVTVTELLTAP